MNKEAFIAFISGKMKLVRIEQDFSQEKMAEAIGLSKKTLVQIEKGRTTASWTTVVAFCALFNHSELLITALGDAPVDFARMVAHSNNGMAKQKTLGGRVWWKEVDRSGDFRLQQNIISSHYRILDNDDFRWFSSFDQEEAVKRLEELASENE